ncbi:MAG: TIGR04283 family arsenosugar biosynthesis glycosyltransferase [Mariprofundus sp.]|nr:TIGR04283 family arsenosugar biosynthesis glycosyltransferase [Mariprofundus sp.]
MIERSVAIIVPVYNEVQQLEQNVQRFVDLETDELIFVDGGSTDQSVLFLQRRGVICAASDPGRAIQMNTGAEFCKSNILVFIHVDTFINKSGIEAIKQAFSQPDVVGGRFDVRLSGKHPAFRIIAFMINLRSRLSKISTGDQVQFVSRSVFEAMHGFAEIPLLEDVEFSKRLKQVGPVACLNEQVITSSRRWEKHGIINTVWLMWKIRLYYWWGVSPEKLAMLYRHAR